MLEHLGDLVLHAEPDTLEVDGDRVIPVFLGAVSRWSVRPRNTGVVMRIIQSAVGLHDLLNQRFNLGCFRDIGPHKRSISPGLFDYPYGLLTAVDNDVRNDSSRPFSRKRQCTCLAYSRSGTRHQGHFVFELFGHLAPLTEGTPKNILRARARPLLLPTLRGYAVSHRCRASTSFPAGPATNRITQWPTTSSPT